MALCKNGENKLAGEPVLLENIQRVVVTGNQLLITINEPPDRGGQTREIKTSWSAKKNAAPASIKGADTADGERNDSLIQSIVRAHVWRKQLQDGTHKSVEDLAEANRIHSKVVRQNLRLAFLSLEVTAAILDGVQPATLSLAGVPKLLPLSWREQRALLD